jgi:hypothetical protein
MDAALSYSFDRNGYRVASASETTDFDAPTIVFTGESIMVGHQTRLGRNDCRANIVDARSAEREHRRFRIRH